MSLLDKIFTTKAQKTAAKSAGSVFRTLTAYAPVFTSWSGCIYESELVRSSIDCLARHTGKLKIEIEGNDTIKKLMHRPNRYQTWYQIMYWIRTILEVDTTCFIVPIYDEYGSITGIYPIIPRECTIVEYNGEPWLRYVFANGQAAAMELSACGILVKHQYRHEFFGDGNRALLSTMDLIHIDNQGIQEAVKNSATFRFMAKLGNFATDEDLKTERQNFTEMNMKSDIDSAPGGVLLFPYTWDDIKQIDSKPYTVDPEERKLIQSNVYRYYGTNEDALQNLLVGDKWGAFYEGAIEPFAIQLSEVLTHMCFSEREIAHGSYIMATANRLQYATTTEKLKVSKDLADRGVLNRDEIREIWNLPPLPNGEGQAYIIRGEYWNADTKINDDDDSGEENNDVEQ